MARYCVRDSRFGRSCIQDGDPGAIGMCSRAVCDVLTCDLRLDGCVRKSVHRSVSRNIVIKIFVHGISLSPVSVNSREGKFAIFTRDDNRVPIDIVYTITSYRSNTVL